MKLTSKEDIEAPIDHVFDAVSNFAVFERQALRRGSEVTPRAGCPTSGKGAAWDIKAQFRGRDRDITAEITEFDAPNGYGALGNSGGIDGVVAVDLVPLSKGRTRLSVSFEMMPKTLSARLLVQSMRMAKGNIQRRFTKRIGHFAEDIEENFRKKS